MEFAWFAVNLGYSRQDYSQLTQTDIAFIRKAYENKLVSETNAIRNAVYNAVGNAFRKKGKPFADLWKKLPKHGDKKVKEKAMQTILEIEKTETGWIDLIYKANGMKKPERRKKDG